MTTVKSTLLAAALAAAGLSTLPGTASAQSPCPLCGAQVPIKDIPKILGEAGTSMGLVRSQALQIGQINNYEMLAKGTMVDLEAATPGQPVEVSKFLWNVQQQQWAQRLEIEGPNLPRSIRVVKGKRAWDESWVSEKTKIGTVNKLRTAAADDKSAIRQVMVWLEPHAFFTQVAFAAGKKCMAEATKPCTTPWSVKDEGGKTILSVEISGRTFTGSLDAKKRIGSVETTIPVGGSDKKIVATYTGWRTGAQDTNNPKDLSAEGENALDKFHNGVFWPEKIVWELDGKKVLDVTVQGGWGNPYTVYPEPELIAKAQ